MLKYLAGVIYWLSISLMIGLLLIAVSGLIFLIFMQPIVMLWVLGSAGFFMLLVYGIINAFEWAKRNC